MRTEDSSWINRVVNLDTYPIDRPETTEWQQVVAQIRNQLADDGCCVLQGFICSGVLDDLEAESSAVAPDAYFKVETVNVYNIELDAELEEDHPARLTFERGNAFVARDQLPVEGLVSKLYTHGPFQRFVAACFETEKLYELADPLAGLCINVLQTGQEHPWHFDTNEFTVSLLTKASQEGGVFEFCPNIRTPERENMPDVLAVLEGEADERIQRLELRCGDLQLFRGRHALHRVSKVEGEGDRHTAIFAYTREPGVIGTVERTRQLFGRVLPEHVEAQSRAIRSDALMD